MRGNDATVTAVESAIAVLDALDVSVSTLSVLDISALPDTVNLSVAAVVPIPTLPEGLIKSPNELAVTVPAVPAVEMDMVPLAVIVAPVTNCRFPVVVNVDCEVAEPKLWAAVHRLALPRLTASL